MAVTIYVRGQDDEPADLDWDDPTGTAWFLWYDQAMVDICRAAQNQADTTGSPQKICRPVGYQEANPSQPIWGVWAWALPNEQRMEALGLHDIEQRAKGSA